MHPIKAWVHQKNLKEILNTVGDPTKIIVDSLGHVQWAIKMEDAVEV